MRTVAGGDNEEDITTSLKELCEAFKVFDTLLPASVPKVGFLLVCKQPTARYCNRRFQTMLETFFEVTQADLVTSQLQAELLENYDTDPLQPLVKAFPSADGSKMLTLRASLIRRSPPVALLVAHVKVN